MGKDSDTRMRKRMVSSLTKQKACEQSRDVAWGLVDEARDAVRPLDGPSKDRAMRLLTEAWHELLRVPR